MTEAQQHYIQGMRDVINLIKSGIMSGEENGFDMANARILISMAHYEVEEIAEACALGE